MRINKFLAECGVASRRKCEQYVLDGLVTVNGKVIHDLATQVTTADNVTVEGRRVNPVRKHVYILMNKPKGCVTTVSDDKGRKTVIDIVRSAYPDVRLFPVGRLDYDTEGLLLLTTDGDFCNRLTHPRSEIEKVYSVRIEGEVNEDQLNNLRNGVVIDGKKTGKSRIVNLGFNKETKQTKLEIAIREGMNREVRRMFESIGKNVVFLKRVAIGDFRLRGLDRGAFRKLSKEEVEYLKNV